MSASRRVVKNFLSLSVAEIASRLLGSLLSFYIARELGEGVFGQFSFAIAFTSFFNIFVDLGLSQLAVRDIAQDKSRTARYGTNIMALQLLISGLLTFLLVGLLTILPLDYTTKVITFFFGLGVIPLALNMQYILQAHERMEFMAIARVVGQVIYALLGFGVIYFTRDVIWLPLAQFVSALIWAIVAYYFIKKYIDFHWERVDWGEIRKLARLSLPFFIAAISVQIYYNIDSILLQFMKGSEEVGIYSAGYKIVLLIILVGSFVVSVFFPMLAANWQKSRETFDKTIHYMARLMGMLAFPITVGGILLAENILLFIYKRPVYLEGALAFQILLTLPIIIFLNGVIGNSLVAIGRQKQNTIAVVIGAVVNLTLNLVLIPAYGINGAAIATVAAEISVIMYLLPTYKRDINYPIFTLFALKPILASVIMGVVIYYLLVDMQIILAIVIAAITYLLGLLALKAMSINEIRALTKGKLEDDVLLKENT